MTAERFSMELLMKHTIQTRNWPFLLTKYFIFPPRNFDIAEVDSLYFTCLLSDDPYARSKSFFFMLSEG